MYPFPGANQIPDRAKAPFVIVEYYARQIRPYEPSIQIPFIPQDHDDVLIYGAAAHALILDTDENNRNAMSSVYENKLKSLVRTDYRTSENISLRSEADIARANGIRRLPITRIDQLNTLLQ